MTKSVENAINLKYIIDNDLYVCCPLLTTNSFIRFCKERRVVVKREQLERFDELGVFKPIARVEFPKIKRESSTGDVFEEYARLWFMKDQAKSWLEENLLWDPLSKPFKLWEIFDNEMEQQRAECYYSLFQVYPLNTLLNLTGMQLRAEWWISYSDEQIKDMTNKIKNWATKSISAYQKGQDKRQTLAYICQILSNRYYPKTQSDRRSYQIPLSMDHHKWDWFNYCSTWDANKVLNDIGMTVEELKRLHEHLTVNTCHIDPLERWYGLVSFVSLDKKKRLKGSALLAQTLYSMSEMIRFFLQDLTREDLPEPNESLHWRKDKFYGEGVTKNELLYLEFLTNQFRLNPRPKLILIVEGNGEAEQLPRLSLELFGYPFSKMGVDVFNLKGVDEFTGKKKTDKYGALEKFIDDHHKRQTIVFVVLDNEGRASKIKEKLTNTPSKFHPNRTITKPDLIHLWNKSIEFDNFTHKEIALAMTELCEDRYHFKDTEIALCEEGYGRRESNPLGQLYKEKLDYELRKTELLSILFRFILENRDKEFDEEKQPKRPVVKVMKKLIELAVRNYQPTCKETQDKNQYSGFLGEPIGA